MVTDVATVAGAGDTFIMNGPLVIVYVPEVTVLAEYPDVGSAAIASIVLVALTVIGPE